MKHVKILKDFKREDCPMCATVFVELNFSKLYVEFFDIKKCKMYSHVFIFNKNNAKICQKLQNIIVLDWANDDADFALINLNKREIIASTLDTSKVDGFELLFKNALFQYLSLHASTDSNVIVSDKECNSIFSRDKAGCHDKYIFEPIVKETGQQNTNKCRWNLEKLEKIMSRGDDEILLNQKFLNSCWKKLFVRHNFYVLGIIYDGDIPKYLGVGIPVITKNNVSDCIRSFTKFLPARTDNEKGFGYYLGFKDIKSGKNVDLLF